MSKERTCLFCQNSYQYCPNCKDYSSEPAWKFNFDTEKCHDLYGVIAGYNIGIRQLKDVKATLDKYGVTDYSIFSKKLQDELNELVSTKKETVEVKSESKNTEVNNKKDNYVSRKMKKNNFERRGSSKE